MNLRRQRAEQPALQFLVAHLGGGRREPRADHRVLSIADTPHQIGESLARQRRRVRQRRQILANLLRFGIVHLELDPFGLMRQLAKLTHKADQVIGGAVSGHAFSSTANSSPDSSNSASSGSSAGAPSISGRRAAASRTSSLPVTTSAIRRVRYSRRRSISRSKREMVVLSVCVSVLI